MTDARVTSVNVGAVADLLVNDRPARSAIDKRPVAGQVPVGRLGLEGDEVGDRSNHGGEDQAVYAYAREDLDWWAGRLGHVLRNGQFGENITTAGLDISGAMIGERWRLGTAVVQVTSPRIPCNTFQSWMDARFWVRRFAEAGRPGAYLRVLEPGTVGAGDEAEVLSRPAVRVTVAESMRAFYGAPEVMRRLLEVEGRGEKWDLIARRVLRAAPA